MFIICYYQPVITFLHLGRKPKASLSLKLATVQVFDVVFAAIII